MSTASNQSKVLQRLQRSSLGLSSRDIARSVQLRPHEVTKILLELQTHGLAERKAGRWKTVQGNSGTNVSVSMRPASNPRSQIQSNPVSQSLDSQKTVGNASLATQSSNDGFVIVVRILGYLSVDSLEFENWLIKNICSSFPDRGSVTHSFGLCARDSGNIAKFLSAVFASRDVGTNDLKSASQILRYRAKATEAMTSELCENVFRVSLRVFEREMANGGRSFAFRWSSLIVVYILRRRMFDSGFAEPEDKLAQHAKVLFSTAIRHSKSGKLHPIGGSVDLPAALQQVIDYIDKKGRGDILMAVENQ